MKYYSEKTVKKIMRKVKVEEIQDSPYDNLYTIQRKYPDLNKFDSIEIREPHGRLIDADELEASAAIIVGKEAWDMVHNAPTILEANYE